MANDRDNFRVGTIAAAIVAVAFTIGSFTVGAIASDNRTERFAECAAIVDATALECRMAAR